MRQQPTDYASRDDRIDGLECNCLLGGFVMALSGAIMGGLAVYLVMV